MRRLVWIILTHIALIGSLAAFTSEDITTRSKSNAPIVVKSQLSQTALRPLLALMKLDLENFENGLAAADETYWCEPMVNNGEAYADALAKDLKNRVDTTLDETAVEALSQSFATLYELCTLADAQDYIENPEYLEAFHTIAELREIVIEEWPSANP